MPGGKTNKMAWHAGSIGKFIFEKCAYHMIKFYL
jgi:hypothetical protein